MSWRALFANQLEKVAAVYPMQAEQSVETLADMLTGIIEGGILLSRCLENKDLLPRQLMQYHGYLKLLFQS